MNNQTATKLIRLMDVVNGTTTNQDASPLQGELDTLLRNNYKIVVSMEDSTPMSSSFLNSSFGVIIEHYGFDFFKTNISIIQCKKSIANRLRTYFADTKSCLPV